MLRYLGQASGSSSRNGRSQTENSNSQHLKLPRESSSALLLHGGATVNMSGLSTTASSEAHTAAGLDRSVNSGNGDHSSDSFGQRSRKSSLPSSVSAGLSQVPTRALVPKVFWFGLSGSYNVLVMELLGPSLEDLLMQRRQKRFGLKTVLYLGEQLLASCEYSKFYSSLLCFKVMLLKGCCTVLVSNLYEYSD